MHLQVIFSDYLFIITCNNNNLLFLILVKKRLLIDFSASYTERNFITPMRAMTEYLLKQSDLESLPKVLRRSPYESEPPITVYYRKDVEAKAIEVRSI